MKVSSSKGSLQTAPWIEKGLCVHWVKKGQGERPFQQLEENGKSHRTMSHTEILVQLQIMCVSVARKLGVQGGEGGGCSLMWKDLPCLVLLPLLHSQREAARGLANSPQGPEIISKIKAEPPGISLQRHNGTFWRNARCTNPHLKLRNLTFVFAAGVELACTQCPVLKLPVWKEEQLHIWERLGSNL